MEDMKFTGENCDNLIKAMPVLKRLNDLGYEAYLVGGSVRDMLISQMTGKACMASDIDVTTNAVPEQVKEAFRDKKVIETGLKHGTVTVIIEDSVNIGDKLSVEITTYRTDGKYSDNRRPDGVTFVNSLTEDLRRRDFTINAIAMDDRGTVVDPFGGSEDLRRGVIRAVGNPDARFKEDGLRIMRALRFAANLTCDKCAGEFIIQEETAHAAFANRHLLSGISPERILSEFKKLIVGVNAGIVIRRYVDILGIPLPELVAMKGMNQHNPHHRYDVLEHCIRTMENVSGSVHLKMAALFHDVGKPETFFMDEEGIGHMYGHPEAGERIVKALLERLRADSYLRDRVAILVANHQLLFREDKKLLKRRLNRFSPEVLMEILEIKRADNLATGTAQPELLERFQRVSVLIDEILREEECFSLRDLAIDGKDILALGVEEGAEVGRILRKVLERVIDGELANEKETLLREADQCRKDG